MPRFVLLEHVGHPDDPAGVHYDLLLEEEESCRTWRLAAIPEAGGEAVAATPLPPHRLDWLETRAATVSGGRGFVRQLDAGDYETDDRRPAPAPAGATIRLAGTRLRGRMLFAAAGTARLDGPEVGEV